MTFPASCHGLDRAWTRGTVPGVTFLSGSRGTLSWMSLRLRPIRGLCLACYWRLAAPHLDPLASKSWEAAVRRSWSFLLVVEAFSPLARANFLSRNVLYTAWHKAQEARRSSPTRHLYKVLEVQFTYNRGCVILKYPRQSLPEGSDSGCGDWSTRYGVGP